MLWVVLKVWFAILGAFVNHILCEKLSSFNFQVAI